MWAARAVPLALLPSGLWRLALGAGIPVGFSGQLARDFAAPGWAITTYLVVLSLVAEGFGLLTLGLVRPWGERFPGWLPVLGGRPVPLPAAVVPAALGSAAVTVLTIAMAVTWYGPDTNGHPDSPHGIAGAVMTLCYAPMLLWGPLLAAVTVSYYRRRTGANRPSDIR
ncbi:hypothetical protein GCM10010166_64300 [Couchioplanes caeruleus subsp. azureus]|nr:hypothetical protein GCM10010166_64300 [Couchioplanes caeruleus subsp. azureus]